MDQELTGNAFRRFMRYRGLSRDPRDDSSATAPDYAGELLQRAPSFHQRDQEPETHHVPSTHGLPASARLATTASSDPGNVRRTQSTFETAQGQSPRRRRKDNSKEPPKKQYRCEYCNLQFGRKHHKERHVANIHRQVSHWGLQVPVQCMICSAVAAIITTIWSH